jgi:tRNA dimethylallyltransferase
VNTKTVILITGPTASGKTSLALTTAQQYNTEIISADSRQCFIEMNIGVAKPSPEELAAVPHHFINSHSIHNDVNAATFAQYATRAAEKIFQQHDVLVMAGGTGLYIKAFLEGLDEIPAVPSSVRNDIQKQYEEKGLQWLQNEIRLNDPAFFAEGEIKNPQRLMRALEVKRVTGKSIKDFHRASGSGAAEKYRVLKFAIDLSREQLYENINNRVDKMIEDGLVEEVRSLLPFRTLNALQTVGYNELFDHFDGKISLNEAISKIKQNTRNYAKRQMTWFRKDKEIIWISGAETVILSEAKDLR